jgi:hypothetical protein
MTSPKRVGHTYDVTDCGENVVLAECSEAAHGTLASRSTSFSPIIFQP